MKQSTHKHTHDINEEHCSYFYVVALILKAFRVHFFLLLLRYIPFWFVDIPTEIDRESRKTLICIVVVRVILIQKKKKNIWHKRTNGWTEKTFTFYRIFLSTRNRRTHVRDEFHLQFFFVLFEKTKNERSRKNKQNYWSEILATASTIY